jgi:hypothetical protein
MSAITLDEAILRAVLGGTVETAGGACTWEPGDGYAYGLLVTDVDLAVVPLLGRWGIGAGGIQITILGVDGVRTWWGERGSCYHETYVAERWYGGRSTKHARAFCALINAAVGDQDYALDLLMRGV